jgi:hypothetical protein
LAVTADVVVTGGVVGVGEVALSALIPPSPPPQADATSAYRTAKTLKRGNLRDMKALPVTARRGPSKATHHDAAR